MFLFGLIAAVSTAVVWYRGLRLPAFLERGGCGCLSSVLAVVGALSFLVAILPLPFLPFSGSTALLGLSVFANWFLLFLLAGCAAYYSAKISKRGEDRHRHSEAVEIYGNIQHGGREPYYVYLRPLNLGATRMRNPRHLQAPFFPSFFNQAKYVGFDYYIQECMVRPVIAIGAGDDDLTGWCLYFDDFQWQEAFRLLCDYALGIIVVPAASAGSAWELMQLKERNYLHKCVFLQPPHVPSTAWHALVGPMKNAGVILPPFAQNGCAFKIDSEGNPTDLRPLTLRDWSQHLALGRFIAQLCGVKNEGRGEER